MDKIGQLLERGFFGGIVIAAEYVGFAVFLCLVYWLMKFLQPQMVRQEEQRVHSHPFYKVSGRGRGAYLILCLEEFLDFSKENELDTECFYAAFLWAHGYGIQIGGYEDDLTHTLTEFFHTQGMEYPEISEIVRKEQIYTDCSI